MKIFYSLLAVLAISACASEPIETTVEMPVEVRQPVKQTTFDVSKIILASLYQSPSHTAFIDSMMETSPDDLTREWLKSRFLVGNEASDLKLEVFIKEASITQNPVLRNGVMDTEYTVYRATVHLEIKIKNGPTVAGAVFSKAFEERVVENYLSIPEKNKIWEDLVYTALEKADVELEVGIDRYLNNFVSANTL